MSFAKMLTDKCMIYHLNESTSSPGYGLPGDTQFTYNNQPDLIDVPCKFTEKSQSITQGEPGAELVHIFAVSFLINVDIRLNDKLVFNGAMFKAQIPHKIRNHHVEVTVIRKENL